MRLGTIEAWISTDDGCLHEYEVTVAPHGMVATCWIASEAGRNFTIHYRDDNAMRLYGLVSYIQLDGIYVPGSVTPVAKGTNATTRSGLVTSPTAFRPFQFGNLTLTDDDTYLTSSRNATQLGNISINIWAALLGEESAPMIGTALPDEHKIHERSKKLFGHCIKLGPETAGPGYQLPFRGVVVTKLWDMGTFVFKYRSLDLLQANDIAPLLRTPINPKDNETREDYAEARELKRLQNRINEIQAHRTRMGRPIVKVEETLTVFNPGEVIDLT